MRSGFPVKLLIAGAALILLSNAVVLARVAYNRAGEPDLWTFTERELKTPGRYHYRDRENSALVLTLSWQGTPNTDFDETWYWLKRRNIKVSRETLQALGFPTEYDCKKDTRPYLSEKAWIALEYDGPVHRDYLAALQTRLLEREQQAGPNPGEEQQRDLKRLRKRVEEVDNTESRLYAVDVAPERETLERRYKDSAQHLILAANVMPWRHCDKPVEVYVVDILNNRINVPRRYRRFFEELEGGMSRDNGEPRYEVTVGYGRLGEVWLTKIRSVTEVGSNGQP